MKECSSINKSWRRNERRERINW